MYTMKPIGEERIIDILNKGRFEGDVKGYILSDGADLFGWILFKSEKGVTVLLDALPPDTSFLDGLIKAAVSYGRERGNKSFLLNTDTAYFKKYKDVFFEDRLGPIPNDRLLSHC